MLDQIPGGVIQKITPDNAIIPKFGNITHPKYKLVGGFNPSEKYARQIGSFLQVGVKKKSLKPRPNKSFANYHG